MFNLDENAVNDLLKLPESGIGFQLISGRFHGSSSNFLVSNAETCIDLTALDTLVENYNDVKVGEWLRAEFQNPITMFGAPGLVVGGLVASRITPDTVQQSGARTSTIKLPISALVKTVTLSAPRKFYRYSPFSNDKRVVAASGDFLPGTYCSPESEQPFVPTGFAAVGRFALPSANPASYQYEIEAATGTLVQFGTVAPAFGQAGGGVEAVFPNGAKNVGPVQKNPKKISDE